MLISCCYSKCYKHRHYHQNLHNPINTSVMYNNRSNEQRRRRRRCGCRFDGKPVLIVLLFSIYFLNVYNINIICITSTTQNEEKNNYNYDFAITAVDAFTSTTSSTTFNTYTRIHKQQKQQQQPATTTGATIMNNYGNNGNRIQQMTNDKYLTLTLTSAVTTGTSSAAKKTTTTKLYSATTGTTTSTSEGGDDVDDTDNHKKQQQQQDSMITNYKQFSYLSFLVSIVYLLVQVPVISGFAGSSTVTAVQVPATIIYSIVGYLSQYVLIGATKHNRLSSDTYKRLNIGLLFFCLLSLLNTIVSISIPSMSFIKVIPIAFYHIYGILVSFNGWKYGVLSNNTSSNIITNDTPRDNAGTVKTLVIELWSGYIESIKSILHVQYPKKSLTYRNCLLLVFCSIFSISMQILYTIRNVGTTTGVTTTSSIIPNTISLLKTTTTTTTVSTISSMNTGISITNNIASISRLILVSTIILSLKDAAERNRLNGTTFIQYNCIISIWAIVNGITQLFFSLTALTSTSISTISTISNMSIQNYSIYRCIQMIVFSYPFTIRAIRSIKEKRE